MYVYHNVPHEWPMNMFILGIPKVCLKKAVICDTRTIEESRGQRFQHGSTSPVASAGMILSVVDMVRHVCFYGFSCYQFDTLY